MTRRVQLFAAASLDGFIAGPHGDVSWRFPFEELGHAPFLAHVDTLLVGRRTYEALSSCAVSPHVGRRVVVFTRSGGLAISTPDTVATAQPPAEVVAQLRSREGGALGLIGGGELAGALFDAGLVDDVIVALHPLVLGAGTPLVAHGTRSIALTLASERRHPSGLLQLVYRVERDHAGASPVTPG